MKKILTSAVVGIFAIALAACGSGDSGTSGGGGGGTSTQPAASSAKTQNATANFSKASFDVVSKVMQSMNLGAAPQLIKSSGSSSGTLSATCSGTTSSFDCTITSSLGGSVHATGSITTSSTRFQGTVNMAFDNFVPEAGDLIKGSVALNYFLSTSAFSGSAMVIDDDNESAEAAKAVDDTKSADSCDITDDSMPSSNACQATTTTCAATNALFGLEFVAGAEGLSAQDVCGTYTWGPGATINEYVCGTFSQTNSTPMIISSAMTGTFNGQAVDASFNMSCTF